MTDNQQQGERGYGCARYLRPGMAGLTVVALAMATACGDDDSDGGDTASTTTADSSETTSPTTPSTPEEQAEAVYLELVNVLDHLTTQEPDPDDPQLAELAVDPLLSDVRDSLTTLAAENQVWEVGDRSSHEVYGREVRSADEVELNACVVENDVLVDRDDGSVVDRPPLATRDLAVVVEQSGDSWVVASIETTRAMEGETSCT